MVTTSLDGRCTLLNIGLAQCTVQYRLHSRVYLHHAYLMTAVLKEGHKDKHGDDILLEV